MIKTNHREINDGYELKEGPLNDRRHEVETKANGHQVPVVWDSAVDYNIFDRDGNKWIVRLPRIPPLNKIPQSDQSRYLLNDVDAFLISRSETLLASRKLDRR